MFLPLISQYIPIFCEQKAVESARKYSKWLNVFAFRGGGARKVACFLQFANSVTFKGHLKEFFEAKNRISCAVDGADSLAKRERRTAPSISDRGPQLLFIGDH